MKIRRDSFGVPYITGPTDAACLFGLGYAQAEDGYHYIEDCFLRALGRGTEAHGPDALDNDLMARRLEIPALARAEFERSTPQMRRIYEAYHAGLERYALDSGLRPKHLERIEPWHPLALFRFKYYVEEFLGYAGLRKQDSDAPFPLRERPNGSNAWAVAPFKSASGRAMLLINPHVGFFGLARYYECALHSAEGLHFQGIARYGFPIPYMGHNARLGWAHTDNYPDNGDLYAEDVRSTDGRNVYRYGNQVRPLREWSETLRVRQASGQMSERVEHFAATHHGPIVGTRDGKPLATRLARLTEGGWFDQWYAMCRARNLAEFRQACAQCAVAYMNIVYADADGNIFYAYGGAVPRRSAAFNWREPVDGSDPRTEWDGYHRFEELPQIVNPPSGYLQSCNSTPFTAARADAAPWRHYPAYMVGPEVDNLRAKRSRALLEGSKTFTFESWSRAATDTGIHAATDGVKEIAAAWGTLPPGEQRRSLQPLVESLRQWDGVSTIQSRQMALFTYWFDRRSLKPGVASPEQILTWLAEARDALTAQFGSWDPAWGDINRLQRVPWTAAVAFDDSKASLPVPGAPGWLGVIFNVYTDPPKGTQRRYGRAGNSYVSVVEFGPVPRARSVLVFGQSMREDSRHYADQSTLYAAGQFKPVWWTVKDVGRNTRAVQTIKFAGK
ncbi:MAG: penicillin acylase family protein [Sphingomicrobium sp.]